MPLAAVDGGRPAWPLLWKALTSFHKTDGLGENIAFRDQGPQNVMLWGQEEGQVRSQLASCGTQ